VAALGRDGAIAPLRLVLVSAAITGIVLAGARNSVHRQELRKREITINRILAVQEALEKYAIDNAGRFPPARVGLSLLIKPPPPDLKPQPLRWEGPYLPSEEYLRDGWGRPFWYLEKGFGDPPKPYQLFSYGRDNSDGGTGLDADIDVWEPDSLVP
jgi:general secretion pathway protein G